MIATGPDSEAARFVAGWTSRSSGKRLASSPCEYFAHTEFVNDRTDDRRRSTRFDGLATGLARKFARASERANLRRALVSIAHHFAVRHRSRRSNPLRAEISADFSLRVSRYAARSTLARSPVGYAVCSIALPSPSRRLAGFAGLRLFS